MAATKPASAGRLGQTVEWIIPIAAVSLVFVMLVPLPAFLLDLLLALSMTTSVLVLLAAVHILRPVQFSVFPSLLLLLTLFRLSLNLASSRRILLHGNEGSAAAGSVIEAFGQFVVGGNYVVGFVLFLALIAIQYMVVSHGAVRTAEVTARFTLDAMPGKQMAIDADLNAGIIDEKQARRRRESVTRESEFYGAMDGAARFNQRDSLATVLITAINIIAGLLIGVFQLDVPLRQAVKTYTILTVGDGLVTMIPSLLVSVAGGIVVTRASSDETLGGDLIKQLFTRPRPLWIAAGVMLAIALIPGLPKVPFFLLSASVGALAWKMRNVEEESQLEGTEPQKTAAPGAPPHDPADLAPVLDDLSLEVGMGLIALVDQKQGGQLLPRVRSLRKSLAQNLGFVVPSVHITDNLRLRQREYVILLRGVEVARWEMIEDKSLAISSDLQHADLPGIDTKEPAFGVAAKWISPAVQDRALAAGYAVVDQTSVLATHLAEVIKQYAHELLSRSETKRLLDRVGDKHPKLTEELVPKILSLGEVQKVLQSLLREHVSIRDLPTILETLLDVAPVTKNSVLMVESVRQALARSFIQPLLSLDGSLKVVSVESKLQEELTRIFHPQPGVLPNNLEPGFVRRFLDSLRSLIGEQAKLATPVLLCSSPARFHLRRLLEPFLPKIVVLSPGEIPPVVPVQSVGIVR